MRYAIALFLMLPFVSEAQDYSGLIEIQKFDKAWKKCQKVLKKNPESLEEIYFSAVIQSRTLAGNLFNPIEAQEQCIKALQIYKGVSEIGKLEKLDEIPINLKAFRILNDSISKGGLLQAKQINSEQGYIDYLAAFSSITDADMKFAVSERNRLAFISAKSENTELSFQKFIDKYPQAIEVSESKALRNQVAFSTANALNSIDGYDDFLRKYPEANERNAAISKRNALAFQQAKEKNKIEAFEYFIQKYPDAVEVSDAQKFIIELSYEEAKRINTVVAFQEFIEKFTNSNFSSTAKERIHELAFEIAKKNNDSKAYLAFAENYPESKQKNDAFQLFQLRRYEENTDSSSWESFRFFIENFDGPYTVYALNNLCEFARGGDFECLKYLCGLEYNPDLVYNKNELVLSAFQQVRFSGEKSDLDKLMKDFGSYLNVEDFLILKEDIKRSEEAEKLHFELPFNSADQTKYIEYIKNNGYTDLAFVALQRLVSVHLTKSEYGAAIKQIENLEGFFTRNLDKIDQLKGIISKATDTKIHPVPLTEINTIGNEYSPVISSDNQVLYFCGKNRTIDNKTENLFYSEINNSHWKNPKLLESVENIENNFAPLSASADGNSLFFFMNGDILTSSKTKFGWTNFETISDKINTEFWEGDMTISSDNNAIIFSRGDFEIQKSMEIVFLVDASGSMGSCINGVQQNIRNFIEGLGVNQANVSWKAKVIYYRDCIDDKIDCYVPNDFTSNQEELIEQLNYSVSGGGDEPESTFEAIFRTLKETKWESSNNSRVIIDFTDATNKKKISSECKAKYGNISSKEILSKLKSDNVKLFLFAQNDFQYNELENENSEITLYDNAVSELQNANYEILMNDLSYKVSLLSSNSKLYHGDRLPCSDLYISTKKVNGMWSDPVKLSNEINTIYTERSPFLHPDLKTLYFSSDGHGGLGKLDVFVSKRLSDTCWNCWSEPVNLGKEINSPNSDWGYKISTDGQYAYFSKDSKSKSREDIYKIMLPSHLRPDYVAKIEGELKNSKNEPIATTIRWEDLEADKVIGIAKTDPSDGSYFIALPLGKNYGYYVEDTTYFPVSNNLDLRNVTTQIEVNNNIQVITFQEMIDQGIAVSMNNLFFAFGKYFVLPASYPELKRIAKIIQRYDLKVEIDGHTDDVGNDESNFILSDKRAAAVKEYLVRIGCKEEMLITHGYGESKPLHPNDNDANRAKNRRVELRLIK